VLLAVERLREVLPPTPIISTNLKTTISPLLVLAKLESEQITGSFKYRGALNKALAASGRGSVQLVTGSTGNHGLAVIQAARDAGLTSKVFIPKGITKHKRALLEEQEVELVEVPGHDPIAAERAARRAHAPHHGIEFVSPYNDLEVIAGHATISIELRTQIPGTQIDVFCATGGGGLATGLALGLASTDFAYSRVFSCAPSESDVLANAVRRGYVIEEAIGETVSDATVGNIEAQTITVPMCRALVYDYVRVDESETVAMLENLRHALGENIEGSAAIAAAGAQKVLEHTDCGATPVVIICGGNGN